MITPCRFIYPYYNNPTMLEMQVESWSRMEGELRDAVRIIVIDDHSKISPVPVLEKCKANVHCYRLNTDWPWNMHEARNIGAKQASKREENHWLFMSDIDIMITPEMAYTMLTKDLDPGKHYTMERVFAPNMIDRKVHPNTFLVKHNVYWQVNGYDLDLTPIGGGGYGGDNQFMRQIDAIAPREHLKDVVLIGYGRRERYGTPVVPDADTCDLDRANWHEKYIEALQRKKKLGDMRSKAPIRTAYTRTL
jgi:glycosyltransferase involved in cell wall biosynthesis